MQSSRMYKRPTSVPFSTEVASGLAEAHGLVSLANEGVKIEWETSEAFFGSKMSKGSILIPLDDIVSVELKRSWFFWYTLIIQTTSLEVVSAIPSSKQGKVSLTISRSNAEMARRFVVTLSQYLTEQDIHLLNEEIRVLAENPDMQRLERPTE